MKKVLFALSMLIIISFFNSCGDDDDNFSSSDLIGTWALQNSKGYTSYNGEKYEWNVSLGDDDFGEDNYLYIHFSEDGEAYRGDKLDDMQYCGQWAIKKDKLILLDEDEGGKEQVNTIKKLDSNELILEQKFSGQDEDGKYEYKETTTSKKVK